MHHIALQRSDTLRAQFMATISIYDSSMFVWLDESGHDRRNTIRKQAYSFRGMPLADHRILGLRPMAAADQLSRTQTFPTRKNPV